MLLPKIPPTKHWRVLKAIQDLANILPRDFLQKWNLTRCQLAALFCCSTTTVEHWFSGENSTRKPQEHHQTLLALIHYIWSSKSTRSTRLRRQLLDTIISHIHNPQEFLKYWELSYTELALVCCCSLTTVKHWFSSKNPRKPKYHHITLLALTHYVWTQINNEPHSVSQILSQLKSPGSQLVTLAQID